MRPFWRNIDPGGFTDNVEAARERRETLDADVARFLDAGGAVQTVTGSGQDLSLENDDHGRARYRSRPQRLQFQRTRQPDKKA